MEGGKESHINADWDNSDQGKDKNRDKAKDKVEDKNKDQGKDKDKDKNAGFSESDINVKLKKDKKNHGNTNWDEKSDLGEICIVKLSQF